MEEFGFKGIKGWLESRWMGNSLPILHQAGYTDLGYIAALDEDDQQLLIRLFRKPGEQLKMRILLEDLIVRKSEVPSSLSKDLVRVGSSVSPAVDRTSAITLSVGDRMSAVTLSIAGDSMKKKLNKNHSDYSMKTGATAEIDDEVEQELEMVGTPDEADSALMEASSSARTIKLMNESKISGAFARISSTEIHADIKEESKSETKKMEEGDEPSKEEPINHESDAESLLEDEKEGHEEDDELGHTNIDLMKSAEIRALQEIRKHSKSVHEVQVDTGSSEEELDDKGIDDLVDDKDFKDADDAKDDLADYDQKTLPTIPLEDEDLKSSTLKSVTSQPSVPDFDVDASRKSSDVKSDHDAPEIPSFHEPGLNDSMKTIKSTEPHHMLVDTRSEDVVSRKSAAGKETAAKVRERIAETSRKEVSEKLVEVPVEMEVQTVSALSGKSEEWKVSTIRERFLQLEKQELLAKKSVAGPGVRGSTSAARSSTVSRTSTALPKAPDTGPSTEFQKNKLLFQKLDSVVVTGGLVGSLRKPETKKETVVRASIAKETFKDSGKEAESAEPSRSSKSVASIKPTIALAIPSFKDSSKDPSTEPSVSASASASESESVSKSASHAISVETSKVSTSASVASVSASTSVTASVSASFSTSKHSKTDEKADLDLAGKAVIAKEALERMGGKGIKFGAPVLPIVPPGGAPSIPKSSGSEPEVEEKEWLVDDDDPSVLRKIHQKDLIPEILKGAFHLLITKEKMEAKTREVFFILHGQTLYWFISQTDSNPAGKLWLCRPGLHITAEDGSSAIEISLDDSKYKIRTTSPDQAQIWARKMKFVKITGPIVTKVKYSSGVGEEPPAAAPPRASRASSKKGAAPAGILPVKVFLEDPGEVSSPSASISIASGKGKASDAGLSIGASVAIPDASSMKPHVEEHKIVIPVPAKIGEKYDSKVTPYGAIEARVEAIGQIPGPKIIDVKKPDSAMIPPPAIIGKVQTTLVTPSFGIPGHATTNTPIVSKAEEAARLAEQKEAEYETHLLRGQLLRKFKYGRSKERMIWAPIELDRIFWGTKNKLKANGWIMMVDITSISEGCKGAKKKDNAFTINTNDRTLELECPSVEDKKMWMAAISFFHKKSKRPYT